MSSRPARGALTLGGLWRRSLGQRGRGLLLALLALATAAFATLVPRAEQAAYDSAVADFVGPAGMAQRDVTLTLPVSFEPQIIGVEGDWPVAPDPPTPFALVAERFAGIVGADAARLLGRPTLAAQTEPFTLCDDNGPTADGTLDVDACGSVPSGCESSFGAPVVGADTREAVIRAQGDFEGHVTFDAGGMTAAPEPVEVAYCIVGAGAGGVDVVVRKARVIPVVILTTLAEEWGLAVGDHVDLTSPRDGAWNAAEPVVAQVAGTYTPTDPAEPFWEALPRMLRPDVALGPEGGTIVQAALVTGDDQAAAVARAMRPVAFTDDGAYGGGLVYEWRYRVDAQALDRGDVSALRDGLADAALSADWAGAPPGLTTDLPRLFDRHAAAVGVSQALGTFVTAALVMLGAISCAIVALMLLAGRTAGLSLLAARGATTRQILGLAVGEVALWCAPAVILVGLLASLLPPGVRWGAAATGVLPVLAALSVAGVVAGRQLSGSRVGRGARTHGRLGPARVGAELLLLALTYLSVATVTSRGEQIAAGQRDWFAALAPVLLALSAALILLRLLPPVMRLLAARAGRGGGVLGFVGLARVARGGEGAVPVVALVLAATLVTLVGSLATSVVAERELAAYSAVGADLRIDAHRIDPDEIAELAARPGVTAVIPAHREMAQTLTGAAGSGIDTVAVFALDMQAYAAALAGTPLAFTVPPAAVAAGPQDAPLPVLASAPFPGGARDGELVVGGRVEPVRLVQVVPQLRRDTRVRQSEVVALSWEVALAARPSMQPDTAFVFGTAEAIAQLAADPPVGLTISVHDRRAQVDGVAGQALSRLFAMLVLVGVVLAGAFSLCAVAMVLLRGRSGRSLVLQRLRVLGLPPRRHWVLAAVDVLPMAVLAIGAGAALGIALLRIMRPVLDLSAYVGGAPAPPLHPSWPIVGAVVVGGLALTVAAVALDSVRARHTDLAKHLRAGGNQ